MFQQWYCELCRAESSVRYAKGAGVYEVRNKIEIQHARRVKCHSRNGLQRVRLGFKPRSQSNPGGGK